MQRLRYMRKSLGMTQRDLSKKTGVWESILTRVERDKIRVRHMPRLLGRLLPALQERFAVAFPETNGDPYDFVFPPTSFGGWMRNFRTRRALKLRDLAEILSVKPFTIIRYESDVSRPEPAVRKQLRRLFGLNGELDRFFGK